MPVSARCARSKLHEVQLWATVRDDQDPGRGHGRDPGSGRAGETASVSVVSPAHETAMRLIRPSTTALRQEFDHHLGWFGEETARKRYRAALRGLAIRKREQARERAMVRLDELDARSEVLRDKIIHRTDKIECHPDISPDGIAAKLTEH